jgi:hypothetical protein
MLSVIIDAQAHDELDLDLDAIVREGARRMLAAALEAEVDDYLAVPRPSGTSAAAGWWSATATPVSARSPPWPGASRCGPRGWTTAAPTW